MERRKNENAIGIERKALGGENLKEKKIAEIAFTAFQYCFFFAKPHGHIWVSWLACYCLQRCIMSLYPWHKRLHSFSKKHLII